MEPESEMIWNMKVEKVGLLAVEVLMTALLVEGFLEEDLLVVGLGLKHLRRILL
jgi:hypothetical protein